jgi:hypothetical protein
VNYYRVQVALAHMGSQHTEHTTWHIATSMSAADVFANRGHLLPGIRRVMELHAITAAEWEAARSWGQQAFRLEARERQ